MILSSLIVITAMSLVVKGANEWTPWGNAEYYAITNETHTFTSARQRCQGLDGDLASIASQDENDAIKNMVSLTRKDEFWIGLYIDSPCDSMQQAFRCANESFRQQWTWIDGTMMSYTGGWKDDEPTGGKNCARLNREGSMFFWKDVPDDCDVSYNVICKRTRTTSSTTTTTPTTSTTTPTTTTTTTTSTTTTTPTTTSPTTPTTTTTTSTTTTSAEIGESSPISRVSSTLTPISSTEEFNATHNGSKDENEKKSGVNKTLLAVFIVGCVLAAVLIPIAIALLVYIKRLDAKDRAATEERPRISGFPLPSDLDDRDGLNNESYSNDENTQLIDDSMPSASADLSSGVDNPAANPEGIEVDVKPEPVYATSTKLKKPKLPLDEATMSIKPSISQNKN